MKKIFLRIFVLCILTGALAFILSDKNLTNVEANAFNETCTMQCEYQKYYCDVNTQGAYDACLNALNANTEYSCGGVNYNSSQGPPLTPGVCYNCRDADDQNCRNQHVLCWMHCGAASNPPPSGGGGRERTPAQQLCVTNWDACFDGTQRTEEVENCIDPGGGTVLDCCTAEYRICMQYAG